VAGAGLAACGLSTVKKLAAFGELGTLWQTAANPLALFRKKDTKAGVGIKECQLRMLCQPLGTRFAPGSGHAASLLKEPAMCQ